MSNMYGKTPHFPKDPAHVKWCADCQSAVKKSADKS